MQIAEVNSIPELLHRAAVEFGDATALEDANAAAERLSYARLREAAARGASRLRAAGLEAGDRVLLAVESRPAWGAAFFAALEAGLIAVPISAETTPDAAAAVAAHAKAKAAIFSRRTEHVAAGLDVATRVPLERLLHPDAERSTTNDQRGTMNKEFRSPGVHPSSFIPHCSSSIVHPPSFIHDTALLAFTSGSTRGPLAVELTHRNLLSNLAAILRVRRCGPGDALLSMLPPAHLFELTGGLLAPLACGARVVYAGSLLPNRLVEALRRHEITHALAVPALVDCLYEEVLSQLAESGVVEGYRRKQTAAQTLRRIRSELTAADLSRIAAGVRSQIGEQFGTLIVGGAAIDPRMAELIAAFGIGVEVGYGLTEAGPVVSVGLVGECPAGSVGRPLPGVEVRIANGPSAPEGTAPRVVRSVRGTSRGQILVRGPSVMRGYFGNPQATADALGEGWLRTGDRGRLDPAGFLFVDGRLKEAMVTSAGETIYPDEVEPHYASPLFAEFCVTALPGPDGNDLPALFVVPAEADVGDAELDEAFRTLRAAAPPRFRVERMIRIDARLPRTATGKIRRRILAQQFQQEESGR